MTTKQFLFVALALMLVAPLGAQISTSAWCARVEAGTESIAPLDPGNAFSARDFEDLRLLVLFTQPAAPGDHILELRLKTPRGHHYQTLTVPITTNQGERGEARRVANYPHPIPVQVLEEYQVRDARLLGTTVSLPVAGTTIVTDSLYGTWSVELFLDGQPMPCRTQNVFRILE